MEKNTGGEVVRIQHTTFRSPFSRGDHAHKKAKTKRKKANQIGDHALPPYDSVGYPIGSRLRISAPEFSGQLGIRFRTADSLPTFSTTPYIWSQYSTNHSNTVPQYSMHKHSYLPVGGLVPTAPKIYLLDPENQKLRSNILCYGTYLAPIR